MQLLKKKRRKSLNGDNWNDNHSRSKIDAGSKCWKVGRKTRKDMFHGEDPSEYLIRRDLFLTQFVNSALVKSTRILTK